MEEKTIVQKLHQKYLKWMADNHPAEKIVGVSFYSQCLTHDYNISTMPPMKDTCSTCDATNVKIKLEEKLGKDTTSLKEAL